MSASTTTGLAELSALCRRVGAAGEPMLEGLDETAAARKALAILAEVELLRWTVPHAFGGARLDGLASDRDVSVRALCAARAELAYRSGMLDVMFVMQGLGSYPIARAGSDALRAEILPRVASGERIAAFALTEPEAGSDLGGIALRAEKRAGAWRLNGVKTFISNAGIASFYTVLARTSGEPGADRDGGKGSLTMFHVPANARGLTATRFEVIGPHPIGELHFDGVEIDDAERLGAVGEGLDVALATLARFRTSVAAAANGFARRALDESIARLKTRKQFSKPLAANQGLRFDLAEMDARLRGAELLVAEAADAVDRGERAVKEVARAKLVATETASWICDRAVQHFGGLGVKKGSVVERLFRDTRALRIYEGTSEIQKLILARELVD
ncbi:MAG: acyl-CoA dehydrogenase family protein [Planctomycetes bacterium]|nr:acyl-CoA dehydrogenase family protein [Planctomycetota bacterium]